MQICVSASKLAHLLCITCACLNRFSYSVVNLHFWTLCPKAAIQLSLRNYPPARLLPHSQRHRLPLLQAWLSCDADASHSPQCQRHFSGHNRTALCICHASLYQTCLRKKVSRPKLHDTLAAIHDCNLVLAHQFLSGLLVIQTVRLTRTPCIRGIVKINRFFPKDFCQIFQSIFLFSSPNVSSSSSS